MTSKLVDVFSELQKRYESEGLDVYGGFSPFLSGGVLRSLGNYVGQQQELLSSSAGIANDEATIMHCICERIEPKRILVVGNSYGFSTVFLALSNPVAKLVAFDKFRTNGIKLTKKVLAGLKDKHVIQASTPDDIPNIIENYLDGSVDFVLIDAVHTNEMQSREFEILHQYLSAKSIVVFHDVLSCGLTPSLDYLSSKFKDFQFRLLQKSSTGMAVALSEQSYELLENYINYFGMLDENVLKFSLRMFKEQNQFVSSEWDDAKLGFAFPPHPQL